MGGFQTESGAVTKFGSLLRSDAPCDLTEQDCDMLLGMGVTTAIDLRGVGEISRRPSSLASDKRFDSYAFHFEDDHVNEMTGEEDVPKGYFEMVTRGNTMQGVMRTIAAAPGGVLFHCTAGKDRTGVTAAILYELVGVPLIDIVTDYQVSETYVRPIVELLFAEFPDMNKFVGRSRPEYIEGFLSRLHEKFGSARGFLLSIGIIEAEIAQLEKKLLG